MALVFRVQSYGLRPFSLRAWARTVPPIATLDDKELRSFTDNRPGGPSVEFRHSAPGAGRHSLNQPQNEH